MGLNARYQFVLLYTVGWDRIAAAAEDIDDAVAEDAIRVGEDAGLPLRHFALWITSALSRRGRFGNRTLGGEPRGSKMRFAEYQAGGDGVSSCFTRARE
jgi:hypothetical protein